MTHLEEVKEFFSSKSAENIATWLDELFRAIHADPDQDISAALAPMDAWYGRNDSYLDDLSAMCRESLPPLEQGRFNLGIGVLLQRYASRHDIPRELIEDAVDLVGRLPAFEASESLLILLRDRGHAMPFLWYDALSSFATLSPAREIVEPLRKLVELEAFPANFAIYAFQYLCESMPSEWHAHWNSVLPKLKSLAKMAREDDESTSLDKVCQFAADLLAEKATSYLAGTSHNLDLVGDEILKEVVMRLPEPIRDKMLGNPTTIVNEIQIRQEKWNRGIAAKDKHSESRGNILSKVMGVPDGLARRFARKIQEINLRS